MITHIIYKREEMKFLIAIQYIISLYHSHAFNGMKKKNIYILCIHIEKFLLFLRKKKRIKKEEKKKLFNVLMINIFNKSD